MTTIMHLEPTMDGMVEWPVLSAHKKSVVTIGTFDGMHRGHREVIARTVQLAQRQGMLSAVIVFAPRPSLVHCYAAQHEGAALPSEYHDTQALNSLQQRIAMIEEFHVDALLVVHYTLEFAAKSYRFFLGQMVGKLGMHTLVLGADAKLGAGCKGDAAAIRELAQATGVFTLEVIDDKGPGYAWVPQVQAASYTSTLDEAQALAAGYLAPQAANGTSSAAVTLAPEPTDPLAAMSKDERRAWTKAHAMRKVRIWSSSQVRYLLAQGRIGAANEILVEPHCVEGVVAHGRQRGRELGFPTANLDGSTAEGYIPADGVYAGYVTDLGNIHEEQGLSMAARLAPNSPYRWAAAISVGTNPTFTHGDGAPQRTIESYALTDEPVDLYDHRLRVTFGRFLRPQIRFSSVDELIAATQHNVAQTRLWASEQ